MCQVIWVCYLMRNLWEKIKELTTKEMYLQNSINNLINSKEDVLNFKSYHGEYLLSSSKSYKYISEIDVNPLINARCIFCLVLCFISQFKLLEIFPSFFQTTSYKIVDYYYEYYYMLIDYNYLYN